MEDERKCLTCDYYSNIEEVCCHYHSEYCGGFVNPYQTWCGHWTNKTEIPNEQKEKQPSCHRHNMPNDKCYGKPYLRNGGIPKKCHECKWFAFRSDRESEQ